MIYIYTDRKRTIYLRMSVYAQRAKVNNVKGETFVIASSFSPRALLNLPVSISSVFFALTFLSYCTTFLSIAPIIPFLFR